MFSASVTDVLGQSERGDGRRVRDMKTESVDKKKTKTGNDVRWNTCRGIELVEDTQEGFAGGLRVTFYQAALEDPLVFRSGAEILQCRLVWLRHWSLSYLASQASASNINISRKEKNPKPQLQSIPNEARVQVFVCFLSASSTRFHAVEASHVSAEVARWQRNIKTQYSQYFILLDVQLSEETSVERLRWGTLCHDVSVAFIIGGVRVMSLAHCLRLISSSHIV